MTPFAVKEICAGRGRHDAGVRAVGRESWPGEESPAARRRTVCRESQGAAGADRGNRRIGPALSPDGVVGEQRNHVGSEVRKTGVGPRAVDGNIAGQVRRLCGCTAGGPVRFCRAGCRIAAMLDAVI